jgi:hypothetical protein
MNEGMNEWTEHAVNGKYIRFLSAKITKFKLTTTVNFSLKAQSTNIPSCEAQSSENANNNYLNIASLSVAITANAPSLLISAHKQTVAVY